MPACAHVTLARNLARAQAQHPFIPNPMNQPSASAPEGVPAVVAIVTTPSRLSLPLGRLHPPPTACSALLLLPPPLEAGAPAPHGWCGGRDKAWLLPSSREEEKEVPVAAPPSPPAGDSRRRW